jgi:hypothetical protein
VNSISLVASEPHYRDHIQPIFDLIPERYHHQRGIPTYMLVGGYADVKSYPTRKYVYVEHGAGQSYTEPTDSNRFRSVRAFYSGGNGHQQCVLFLCPNDAVAARWQERYPDTPTAVVGCPKLDPWHSGARGAPEERTVAITFHWDAIWTGVPETLSAFEHYYEAVVEGAKAWQADGWTVLAHSHPRHPAARQYWESAEIKATGIEYVSADTILDRASMLIADNTSMQAEFLSLGRRVVWINHPAYRKDVDHGGRFWSWPEMGGLQVDSPAELTDLNLDDVPATTGHPYAFADGHASERAAGAVLSVLV